MDTTIAKLAGFVAILALSFGVALGVGAIVGPINVGSNSTHGHVDDTPASVPPRVTTHATGH